MTKQRVLFLCTGNSARSQMAEGLLRHFAGERFEVFSAGTRPAGINPNAVIAMAELGISIAGNRSKSVDEFAGQRFDYVFTVCDNAKESCPVFPGGGKKLHESFRDPAAAPADKQLGVFREVRDQISERLQRFVREES
jgi:arsenate reductase (thioredoxin)